MIHKNIILDTDPEAASIQTVTGWVCRYGHFWGADEHQARYLGSTHTKCACGTVISHRGTGRCNHCQEKKEIEQFKAMPTKVWDETGMIYSGYADKYFRDWSEIDYFCSQYVLKTTDLRLVICEGNYASLINAKDYLCDELVEDDDVPEELKIAFNALNKAIAAYGRPLSYFPSDYAVDLTVKGNT